jgi:hypothetical protein
MRQVIVRKSLTGQTGAPKPSPTSLLRVTRGCAYVINGIDLYRWELPHPNAENTAENTAENVPMVAVSNLIWKPKQSALTVAASGMTSLTHELLGARPPVTFSTITSFDSIQIDPVTSVVTIDNAAIMAEAKQAVEGLVKQQNRGESYTQTLRSLAQSVSEHTTNILGRKPTGFPVAIPIHITASDSELASSELRYFVIAEVSGAELFAKMTELDREREEQAALQSSRVHAENKAAVEGAPSKSEELAELKRKVIALEQRVDLMTRQLNKLLQKLETKDSP